MYIDYRLIDGYDNYIISNLGEIYSKKRKRNIKPWINKQKKNLKDGTIKFYKCKFIGLCKNGKKKNFKLHRLLALHFIPNPENKPCVDHIDGDSLNNNLNNLRWATKSENCRNRKTKGYCITKCKIKRKKTYRIDWPLLNGKTKSKYFLTKELAQTYADSYDFPLAKNYNVVF